MQCFLCWRVPSGEVWGGGGAVLLQPIKPSRHQRAMVPDEPAPQTRHAPASPRRCLRPHRRRFDGPVAPVPSSGGWFARQRRSGLVLLASSAGLATAGTAAATQRMPPTPHDGRHPFGHGSYAAPPQGLHLHNSSHGGRGLTRSCVPRRWHSDAGIRTGGQYARWLTQPPSGDGSTTRPFHQNSGTEACV